MKLTLLIVIALTTSTFVSAQSKGERARLGEKSNNILTPDVVEFEIPLGSTVNSFNYSNGGVLTYNGRNFSPSVTANARDVHRFKISLLRSSGLAGAISVDVDGQNKLFLLNTNNLSSTPMQLPGQWNAAQRVFWSPSRKYMVALCSYEGQRFIGMDLNAISMVEGEFLGRGGRTWTISSEPRWLENSDVLIFNVGEYCNPYDDSCTGAQINKLLATYEVRLDAATLALSPKMINTSARQRLSQTRSTRAGQRASARNSQTGRGIRGVDFANFTYDLSGSDCQMFGRRVKVRNGEFGNFGGDGGFGIDTNVVYGDLTGDGQDEAVVRTACGLMHPVEQAYIYTMLNGKPVLLTRLQSGERGNGGILMGHLCEGCRDGLRIENGSLVVERMWGYACCPEYIETKTYRWNGRKLTQIGKAQKRKFIPRN